MVSVYPLVQGKLLDRYMFPSGFSFFRFSHNFEAAHILKTDDDTLVNLRTVVDVLFSAPLQGNQWWGK